MQQLRDMMNNKKQHFIIYIGLVFAVLLTAPAAVCGGVSSDAYSYEDDFQDSLGMDITASHGFAISDGKLVSNATSATAVSQCIKFVQPEGARFQEWSCLQIDLEDTNNNSSLAVQTCGGSDLKTVNNLITGKNTIDLSDIETDEIRLVWEVSQAGAKANSWKVYGKAEEGPTVIDVIPDIETPDVGDTVMFTIRIASSGTKTRNPVLRFSLDDINGPGGLAEDAEYRPLEFVSASNGPNSEAPKMKMPDGEEMPVDQASGVTSGQVVWNLKDMSDGFADNATVTLKIPKGYINGKTLKARATLEHGVFSASDTCDNRMTEEAISGSVKVTSVHNRCQGTYTSYSNVGPGAKNILDRYSSYNGVANNSDIEDVTFTITGIGDCKPIFQEIRILDPDSKEYVSKPVNGWVSEPIIGSDSIVVHFNRIDFYHNSAFFEVLYDVPDGCNDGAIGTQSQVVGGSEDQNGNRQWNELGKISHPIVVENCREGVGYVHRVMSGNDAGDYFPWPEYIEYYIGEITGQSPKHPPGSLRAGEYFTTWAPYSNDDYRTHTISLNHSYNLTEIPEGTTFHGVRFAYAHGLSRLYKDCTGTALEPTHEDFLHGANLIPQGWKPVDITWNGPFSNPADVNDPKAVVLPGCRLLGVKDNDKPAWMKPDYGKWRPYFLWRACDGSYGCDELDEGTAMSLVGGRIYTYETVTDPAGTIHYCDSYNGQTVYKESKSWPKVHAWPEQNQVHVGEMASIIINPENSNHASQYVDGRWVVNLYDVREYIDFEHVMGEVLTDGLNIPKPGQNVIGVEKSCNIADDIIFHHPGPKEECNNPDDVACMAWWEVPVACQPPNGWGFQELGNQYRDDYVPMYRFRLKAKILETTLANTVLDFVAEVRTNNLTARGADNTVTDTDRWAYSNYAATASVTVLETPGLDIMTEGTVNQKAGHLIKYQ